MNDKKVADAILELKPNIGITVKNYDTIEDTFNNIIFDDDSDKTMSLDDVNTKITEIENRDAHIEPRLNSYPEISEQLDKLYHDMTANKLDTSGDWYTSIKAIKDANPKN